ncbi:universal stress protein [Cryptosporangium arvum]|uniref:Universal stress protein UspA-like protein n=1 Tax=Cryptosporangium arvum DSM 44712 TaxID=927661 RepID=A0A010ZUT0_9ACTN|nr:universal stress protein [Cryptosporangium arvum]EXG82454.1 universal stress protein UspA-like protein [Cryptosporangium arvum DSM 44712]
MTITPVVTVGIDGSESARAALDWAVEYARAHGASLRLVNGLELPEPSPAYTPYPIGDVRDAVEKEACEALDAARTRVHETAPEVEVTTAVVAHPPVPALLEASGHSALLVVGCHGWGEFAGLFLGSVSASVTAHAACPVVVVRGDGAGRTAAPVVVGVHGSGDEDATLETAFGEAARRRVPLVAVSAWSDVTLENAAGAIVGAWPTWDRLREEAGHRLEATLRPWRDKYPSLHVGTMVVRDRPAAALLDRSAEAQLLVVGSRGRGGFAGMRLGSVPRRLVHHAHCPVLVVRHAEE